MMLDLFYFLVFLSEERGDKKQQCLIRHFERGFFSVADKHLFFVIYDKSMLFLMLSASDFSSLSSVSLSLLFCWSFFSLLVEKSSSMSFWSLLLDLHTCLSCVNERRVWWCEEILEIECLFFSWRLEHLNQCSLSEWELSEWKYWVLFSLFWVYH